MRKFMFTIGWLASLGLLLTACGVSAPAPTASVAPAPVHTSPQVGAKAPDFTLNDSAGNSVKLAEVVAEHKSTVLVFYLSHT